MLVFVLALLLAVLVLGIVTTPLRRLPGVPAGHTDDELTRAAAEVENLEAERDAKYREIRDAELDRQTGHLSESDFATIDAGLRSEAIDLLKRLDRANQRLAKLQRDARPETLGELTADAVGDGVVEAAGVAEDPEARYHRPRT
jgi:hypothetical protein